MGEVIQENEARVCAAKIMEVIPNMMRTVFVETRKRRLPDLTEPQFRALMIIHRHQGASLSLVAEHLKTTLSSTSKLIDGLVDRLLLSRLQAREDRRRITLQVTDEGQRVLGAVHQETVKYLAERLGGLTPLNYETIFEAFVLLGAVFTQAEPTERC